MTTSHRPTSTVSRSRGRPREFDIDQALDRAVEVFSKRGYHGTSITDLTKAMDLTQGSLYKAFKGKRAIFLAAFEHYRAQRTQLLRMAVDTTGTGLERLRNVLIFYAESAQGAQGQQGCLVVGSATELSAFDQYVAEHVISALTRNESMLADMIRQGQQDGSLAPHVDCETTARMLLCLTQGMRVVGKTGRRRKDMLAVVDAALKALG
ncbi:MAG: TetR/AcrR family transcriptional regulator [Halomonadaceae bacterium]|uniref:TetR/AcrR family transcriptional regulator n=1 Tax=Halomonas colorata TaxID=2742615 RepID=A0ABR9FWY5_9GAMM|nr:TetR/AcrR family transcriptional regulator [Halomonas colorata]MBE0463165.1 TetR/AcrR family transcriptional regulator [Halomonas colorata]